MIRETVNEKSGSLNSKNKIVDKRFCAFRYHDFHAVWNNIYIHTYQERHMSDTGETYFKVNEGYLHYKFVLYSSFKRN